MQQEFHQNRHPPVTPNWQTFTSGCQTLGVIQPSYLRSGTALAEAIGSTYYILASTSLRNSADESTFARSLVLNTLDLADRLYERSASRSDMDLLERVALAGRYIGTTQTALTNSFSLIQNLPSPERSVLFKALDAFFKSESPQTETSLWLVNALGSSFQSTGTGGTFQALTAFVTALHRLESSSTLAPSYPLLRSLMKTSPNQFMVNAFERQASTALSVPELTKALGHLVAFDMARKSISYPTADTNLAFRLATGGLPLGFWDHKEPTSTSITLKRSFLRLADAAEGFHADTFTARRVPVKYGRSILDRFGSEIGSVRILNHKDHNGFPGPGLIIQNIRLENALRPYLNPNGEDPLAVYREIWPQTAPVLHHLPESRFFISRAEEIITGPRTEMYRLKPVPELPAISYSLVLLNVNHGNNANHIAYLVPSEIIDKKLTGCSVQTHPVLDLPDPLKDINSAGLQIEALRVEAHRMGYPLIAVGSPATLSGHYEYAIDPEFSPAIMPLDSIVDNPDHQRHLRNANNHQQFGPSSRVQSIYGHQGPEIVPDIILHHLKRPELATSLLHQEISILTERLIQLWQGVKYIRATWSKGQTGGAQVGLAFTHEEFQDALRSEDLPVYWNGNSVRMLIDAYAWNQASRENSDLGPERFPVLVLASSQWHSPAPEVSRILIDTYHRAEGSGMILRSAQDKVKRINSNHGGNSVEDAVFFVREVLQHAQGDHIELRFCDRRLVQWEF